MDESFWSSRSDYFAFSNFLIQYWIEIRATICANNQNLFCLVQKDARYEYPQMVP